MAVVFPDVVVRQAVSQALRIHADATNLRNRSVAIDFDNLRGFLDRMREGFVDNIDPLLAYGPVAADAAVADHTVGAPVDTHDTLSQLRQNLVSLYQAYGVLFGSLTPVTYTVAGGHATAQIPLAQLAPLAAPLDQIIATSSAFL